MNFHKITQQWFLEHIGVPTPVQAQAWPAIKSGRHTLIAAPTGSGKTLAAFYSAIDDLVVEGLHGTLIDTTTIVYVSPLKALSNDINRNLQVPLSGIKEALQKQGHEPVHISVAVRTGDTTVKERQQMLKHPPHILVTTPESLYLLLTSKSGREMLRSVKTLIIDEIHALVDDKRGSHLSLSMERLEALTGRPLQRIGLSATQKPIELVAKFLVGNKRISETQTDCVIIDTGHRRTMDLHLEIPNSPLAPVMSNEVWSEIHERLVELIKTHQTTLIFVNTRRLAERLAMALGERIGEEHVSSHHGSMSKEHRHSAEQRLKEGHLKVLVATASMELGIDIGFVDLVVQFSSPKSIATFVQRVGRSGHQVGGTPKGIIFPLSQDELIECTALLDSVRRGELDRIIIPEKPLDVLSQQIVAEVAAQEWGVDELYDLFHNSYPYRDLTKEEFISIVQMLSEGFTTRRGRRNGYLHYDGVNNRLRARPNARLVALTNGGAIPDMFDYDVVLPPEGIVVGTLNEDFALESLAGDIFTLGTHSWQLVRIEGLKVMVHDAAGRPPSVPFWLGEGRGRSDELSESVSRLRRTISDFLDQEPLPLSPEFALDALKNHVAVKWLVDEVKIVKAAAEQLVLFLWVGKCGLGLIPTRESIILERFFDSAGDMHLVIHSLYGSHVNRAWGLALRKKFCRNFNFELQAAATENCIILSLSSSHSFALEDVFKYLNTKILRETLIQAMLDAPLFEIRWRYNATRALAIQRNRGGKRVPPVFQRMQAEDLIAQVFPDQIACFENIQGERQIPDHPLVTQVIHDCLTEAMDIDGLEKLIGKIETKTIDLVTKDLREPSVFAQEVITARPYAFLDDTEFAERRVNAIKSRSWLDPKQAGDLSQLDPKAIENVKEEAWPLVRNADELHDALMIYSVFTKQEIESNGWQKMFEELVAHGRATRLILESSTILTVAAERVSMFQEAYPKAVFNPQIQLPEWVKKDSWCQEDAICEIIRGRLEAVGPITLDEMAQTLEISRDKIEYSMLALEHEGFVLQGKFTPRAPSVEWCERRLLARIHKYTIESLRESIKPVSVQDFMRFLFSYHNIQADNESTGPETLGQVLSQLEGYEAPAASWEIDLIPSRMGHYDPSWLDVLCMSGKIVWGRFTLPKKTANSSKKAGPVKSTPISLISRGNRSIWEQPKEEGQVREMSTHAQEVLNHLKDHGASFFDDIVRQTSLLKSQAEEGIGELVAEGLLISDSYSGLRALLTPEQNKPSNRIINSKQMHRKALFGIEHAGRWVLMPSDGPLDKQWDYETLEAIIWIYLKRWGVIFRSLIVEKEHLSPPWRMLLAVLRRMELRGELRGGRFISNVSGEQFALPETIEQLRRMKPNHDLISISAVDPLNLLGVILPGKKVSNITSNRIAFQDGLPIAVWENKEAHYLIDLPQEQQWSVYKALIQKKFPTKLRYYLGRH